MSASARPSERRPWRRLLLALALLLAALPAGAQDRASRSPLTRLVESLVPGLTVEGLRGPLADRPGFARLTLADAQGVWLEVEAGEIDWSATALLRRQVHVESLRAARLVVHRPPVSDAPADPSGGLLPEPPQLPVALRIDRLAVERIELREPVVGQPVALRATGSARFDAEGMDVGLDAALVEGATVLSLRAAHRAGGGPLSASVTLRAEPGGPVSRLAGLGDRPLALDVSLEGPASGAAFRLVADAGPGARAAVTGSIAAAERLAVVMQGEVDGSGLVEDRLAPLAGPLAVTLDLARQAEGIFALSELRLAGAAGEWRASGVLDPEGARNALALRATLPGSAVFAPLLPDGVLAWDTMAAEATVTGALAAPRVALSLAPDGFHSTVAPAMALLGRAPRLDLRATAPDRIEALSVTGQALRAEASGRVGETLDLAFRAELAATEGAVPGLAGALSLRGTAAGAADDPTLTLDAESDRLEAAGGVVEALRIAARIATPLSRPQASAEASGRFAGLPLSLALRGEPAEDGWLLLERAEASLGPARLGASGRLHPTMLLAEGQALLEAADLAPFSALLGQPLAGTLRLQAEGAPVAGRQRLSLRLEAPRLTAAGLAAQRLVASAEGDLAGLDIAVSGVVNDIAAEARGRLAEEANGARHLDLAALRATAQGETLRLATPTRLSLLPDGAVALAGTTLALPRSGTLRAEGRWGPERADLRATLAGLELAAFAGFAPGLAPGGTLSGEARITGATAAPEVVATLRGVGLASGAARGLPRGELRLDLRRVASGLLTAEGQASFGPRNRLAATARFPQGPTAAAPFEGSLNGALDLGDLTAPFLAAGADRVTGRLSLALNARGTPAAPVLGGQTQLAGGSYRNAPLGVAITDIAGTFRTDGPLLRADLAGRTPGEGRITLAGSVSPLARHLPLDLVLTATEATPVVSDLLRATLDARLTLTGTLGEAATLAGPVRIRRADIRVPEQLGSGVRSLGEVTEIGAPPGQRPRPRPAAPRAAPAGPPLALAITVEAPRNVFVRGRGLDAELGGALAIGGRIAAPEITGALDLRRGDLTVVGRRLAFDRGRLTWTGALMPDLALRASSQAGGTSVAVEVSGPPTDPRLVFTSTPELPQDEVLARLLFDRPVRALSPFEIAQVAAVVAGATGIAGGGPEGLLERVRQGLGLDRLSVGGGTERAARRTTAEERGGPTVEAGRYVADGIYVGVRQGTEPGSSRVGVRVDLTSRLKLEAETGDREAGNRVGLSYQWEWGR